MRRLLMLVICVLLVVTGCAAAEALDTADLSALEEFASEYADGLDVRGIAEAAVSGDTDFSALLDWLKGRMAAACSRQCCFCPCWPAWEAAGAARVFSYT